MPQRVICRKCGFVLYEGIEFKPPYEIVEKYEGKCPNCGKKLSHTPKNFEVKSADETKPSPSEKKRSSRRKSARARASRKETTFVEYKPELIIVKEMKTPRNSRNA